MRDAVEGIKAHLWKRRRRLEVVNGGLLPRLLESNELEGHVELLLAELSVWLLRVCSVPNVPEDLIEGRRTKGTTTHCMRASK